MLSHKSRGSLNELCVCFGFKMLPSASASFSRFKLIKLIAFPMLQMRKEKLTKRKPVRCTVLLRRHWWKVNQHLIRRSAGVGKIFIWCLFFLHSNQQKVETNDIWECSVLTKWGCIWLCFARPSATHANRFCWLRNGVNVGHDAKQI